MQLQAVPHVVNVARPATKTRVHSDLWTKTIVIDMRKRMQSGMKIMDVARGTGLCHSTVSKLIYGDTKFPRMNTVLLIMNWLGYDLYAER